MDNSQLSRRLSDTFARGSRCPPISVLNPTDTKLSEAVDGTDRGSVSWERNFFHGMGPGKGFRLIEFKFAVPRVVG
jgi:hypothetical protein